MFRLAVIALLPELVEPVCRAGVVGRACERGLLSVNLVSPRDFTSDRHRTTDDRPYGGGPGMVLKYEPVRDAIRAAGMRSARRVPTARAEFVLSARGKSFDQAMARKLAAGAGLLLVAGRYEGIDERIVKGEVSDELSLGDFVLSGGELAAAVVIDAVARLLPGVLGHEESARHDSHMEGLLGHPHFTRPETVDGMRVPDALLGGHHEAIRRWRLKQALGVTWLRRPELLEGREMTPEEHELLQEFIREHKDGGP